jgi:hypothetical protein
MASIAITPNVTLTEKRRYGSRLLARIMDVHISLSRGDVILETIVAGSSTAEEYASCKAWALLKSHPEPKGETLSLR